jgi:thiol:disulfide interchange protein
MSLRMFHLFFIALSVVLAAFFAAWATGQFRLAHEVGYAIAAIGGLAACVGLAFYGAAFQRKTRHL